MVNKNDDKPSWTEVRVWVAALATIQLLTLIVQLRTAGAVL